MPAEAAAIQMVYCAAKGNRKNERAFEASSVVACCFVALAQAEAYATGRRGELKREARYGGVGDFSI
jgi:hypothetical protein